MFESVTVAGSSASGGSGGGRKKRGDVGASAGGSVEVGRMVSGSFEISPVSALTKGVVISLIVSAAMVFIVMAFKWGNSRWRTPAGRYRARARAFATRVHKTLNVVCHRRIAPRRVLPPSSRTSTHDATKKTETDQGIGSDASDISEQAQLEPWHSVVPGPKAAACMHCEARPVEAICVSAVRASSEETSTPVVKLNGVPLRSAPEVNTASIEQAGARAPPGKSVLTSKHVAAEKKPHSRAYIGLVDAEGVVIRYVDRKSVLHGRLVADDVIISINGQHPTSARECAQLLYFAGAMTVVVQRRVMAAPVSSSKALRCSACIRPCVHAFVHGTSSTCDSCVLRDLSDGLAGAS